MTTQKLEQGNGNQENQGKRFFLRLLVLAFFFFLKIIFEQGLRKTAGADHVDNRGNISAGAVC